MFKILFISSFDIKIKIHITLHECKFSK